MGDEKQELARYDEDAELQDFLLAVGRAQAFGFMRKVAHVGNLRSIAVVKKSKSYKYLSVRDKNGKWRGCATFAEFCEHFLGESRRSVDEHLQNYEALGEPLLEAGRRVGIGRDDFRVLRQIPQEQLAEIEDQVINTQDKDEVRALIEDIVTAHNETKEGLEKAEKRARKLESDLADVTGSLQDAREQLRQKKACTWPEFTDEVRMESLRLTEGALLHIDDLERYMDRLMEPDGDLDPNHPERFSHYNTALMSWWLNVRALHARLSNLIDRGLVAFGDQVDETPESVPLLDEEEAQRLLSRHKEMLFLYTQAKEGRERGRAAKRGKRGRPKGSKNKQDKG